MKKRLRVISLIITFLMLMQFTPVFATTNVLLPISKDGVTFRFGVMSDTHIGYKTNASLNNINKALDAFEAIGNVDALAFTGDMTYAPSASKAVDYTQYVYGDTPVNFPTELYNNLFGVIQSTDYTLAGTLNNETKEFTADTSGGKKPIIYSMGNHEFNESDRDVTRAAAAKALFYEKTGRTPAHTMKVGGYTFIMPEAKDGNNNYVASEEFVKAEILKAEAEDPSNKPIFYLQHESVFDTVIDSPKAIDPRNSAEFKAFLNEHPRVIVLSAHTHVAENDPRTIWQDGFTVVSSAHIGGSGISKQGATFSAGDASKVSQCLLVDLTEKDSKTDVAIYRIDASSNKLIGNPYTFTIDGTSLKTEVKNETFKYSEERRNGNISKASYKDSDSLNITNSKREGFTFSFPTKAEITKGDSFMEDEYIHSYRVVVENTEAGAIAQNFTVFGDFYEEESDRVSTYTVTLPRLLDRATNYKISLYALTPFMHDFSVSELKESGITPLTAEFTTSSEFTLSEQDMFYTYENNNVALYKPVYAGCPQNSHKLHFLTDGAASTVNFVHPNGSVAGAYTGTVPLPSGATVASATSQANDWFIIDLGKRYKIDSVNVHARATNHNRFMQHFNVEASNTEDFTEYAILGQRGATTDCPEYFTAKGNGNYYRYVRIRKTASSEYGFSEIEVFADYSTLEVSRFRNAEANKQSATSSNIGGEVLVDGIVNDATKCWVIESNNALPSNVVVDLEKDYPIGVIRMFSRWGYDGRLNFRTNWAVYAYTNAQGKPDPNTTDFSDAKKLIDVKDAFPGNGIDSKNPVGLCATFSGAESYRYLVFAKTAAESGALGEIRAEIMMPEITEASRNDSSSIKVGFSDKIDINTLNNSTISLTDVSGNTYELSDVSFTVDAENWDGGYDAILTFSEELPDTSLTLTLDGGIKTLGGTDISKKTVLPISGEKLSINKLYTEQKENINVALYKPIYAGCPQNANKLQVLTDGNKTVSSIDDFVHPNGIAGAYTGTVSLPSGATVASATSQANDWFIIDLGKRYKIETVKVYARATNHNRFMQYFNIEASNTEDFKDYATLGKRGATTDCPEFFEAEGNGNYYRYVRIRKTGSSEYGFSEIEVFADFKTAEVSRGATVTANEKYTNGFNPTSPDKSQVVDGITSSGGNGWLFHQNGTYSAPYNIMVDLGRNYPVEMIEAWGRGDENSSYASIPVYRQNWKYYGYSEENSPQSSDDITGSPLATVGTTPFPASGFKTLINPGMYRYFIISKTESEYGCLGEFRALVVYPEVTDVVFGDDNTVTISFTDKMEATTLTEDYIEIDGLTLSSPELSTGWDGGYEVTFNYEGEIVHGAKVRVSEEVRSQNGIELCAEYTEMLKADIFTLTQNGTGKDSLLAENTHEIAAKFILSEDTDAIMYVAIKDANGKKLISCIPSSVTTFKAGIPNEIKVTGIIPKAGEKVYAYIWENGTYIPLTEFIDYK